jgi:hypothetical protein
MSTGEGQLSLSPGKLDLLGGTMLVQSIQFQRTRGGKWEDGVARVKQFGISDVVWCVDEAGNEVLDTWAYRLIEGPMCYIETQYR